MARENYVYIMGRVSSPPDITYDKHMNMPITGKLFLDVYGGRKENKVCRTSVQIIVKRQKQLEILEKVEVGTIIGLKGVICTESIAQFRTCTHCGIDNSIEGIMTYISPVHMEIQAENYSQSEGDSLIATYGDLSNTVRVIGTICSPRIKKTGDVCHYQIAINRKYRIVDSDDLKSDFPWVRSKIQNEEYIKQKMGVFVCGYLSARNTYKKTICASCGEEFEYENYMMEITAKQAKYFEGLDAPVAGNMDENYVQLFGCVDRPSEILKKNNIPMMATSAVNVLRRHTPNLESYKKEFAAPIIKTMTPELIQTMTDFEMGDVVDIRGTLCAKEDVPYEIKCPDCKKSVEIPVPYLFVSPVEIRKRGMTVGRNGQIKRLQFNAEISNNVRLFGKIVRIGAYHQENNGNSYYDFQIEIHNRFISRITGQEKVNVFRPWVRSFNEQAYENATRLQLGSYVYVDGYISTEREEEKIECPECKKKYKAIIPRSRVVEYVTEYMGNWLNDDLLNELLENVKN